MWFFVCVSLLLLFVQWPKHARKDWTLIITIPAPHTMKKANNAAYDSTNGLAFLSFLSHRISSSRLSVLLSLYSLLLFFSFFFGLVHFVYSKNLPNYIYIYVQSYLTHKNKFNRGVQATKIYIRLYVYIKRNQYEKSHTVTSLTKIAQPIKMYELEWARAMKWNEYEYYIYVYIWTKKIRIPKGSNANNTII